MDTISSSLKEQLASLDDQLLTLFNQRASLVQTVGLQKRGQGKTASSQEDALPLDESARLLAHVTAKNPGPLGQQAVQVLFTELLSACSVLVSPLKVAFLGPEGTFTHSAAIKHFGHQTATLPASTIHEVFRAVEVGSAHYGVVPVENSTEGSITHTLDKLTETALSICGEIELRVHHCLLCREEVSRSQIKRIYAHPQAFAQCRHWLNSNFPHAEWVSAKSNAEGARDASLDSQSAAIAGVEAAGVYQLAVVFKNIEDDSRNTTRFLVIGNHSFKGSEDIPYKTSMILSAKNDPGALYRLLSPLAEHQISMTRIESRPSRQKNWEYIFFIDIEGHSGENNVEKALAILKKEALLFRILGSYPKAISS